jgi:hypothetical protein
MPGLHILQAHYMLWRGHSGAGIHAYVVESLRRPGTFRVAYCRDKDSRWHLSAGMSRNVADTMLDLLHGNMMRGHGSASFIHRLKIFGRENLPARWKAHQRMMEARKEARVMSAIPTFGMF